MNNWNKTVKLPDTYCDLFFNEAVTKWDEAIPLGNGLSGCLIWGDGKPLRFSLDRGDLWDTRPAPETMSWDFTYKKLIELVGMRDTEKINRIFDDCYNRPTPTKIPAGRLEVNYDSPGERLESHLSLRDAVAKVTIKYGRQYSQIETFLHATKTYGYIHITGNRPFPGIDIKAPEFGTVLENDADLFKETKEEIKQDSLKQLRYPLVKWFEEGCFKWFAQKTAENLEYGIIIGQKTDQDAMDIVYLVASNKDGDNWVEIAKNKIQKALEAGYNVCLTEHKRWWEEFWGKSSIALADKEFEKQWYITNYLFGSCSRKGAPPMPLQGVWTADDGTLPPWKGDYHNDLNTQMSYYHYLKANHLKEGESFLDFLWQLKSQAEKFAAEFFDAPGINLPSVMSIDGKPLGGWPMYSLSLTNHIWLCKAFEDYWKTTGDLNFLKDRAYPWFEETARCITRWLKKNENGKLILPVSSSPEIHDNTLESWLTPNSNYDLSLLLYLFKTLSEMSKILGNGDIGKWMEIYEMLPELAVNKDNVLMLSPDESLNESHRHFAHAMAIHPLRLLDYDNNERDREIIDATIDNLEQLGMRWWVGFSFTWMAELYAIQKNGEAAAFQLKLFRENLCSQNGFHLNGDFKNIGLTNFHYRPFTLEANMCAADALQEMLLQTHKGIIHVFPSIPEAWRKKGASFCGFKGENGIEVSSSIKNKEVEYVCLKASKDGVFKVKNVFSRDSITIQKENGERNIISCNEGCFFEIALTANEQCFIY